MTCRPSILDGMTVEILRSRLEAMQQAYLDLMSGGKVVTVSYAQGDGSRSVSYSQAQIADLVRGIQAVQKQIAILEGTCVPRGRPIFPVFN